MNALSELVVRWQRGWGVARALDPAEELDGGLRMTCRQPGREVEYLALTADDDPASLSRLAQRVAGEDVPTWLTVPTTGRAATADALHTAGMSLLGRAESLMVIDLPTHPEAQPAPGYRLSTQRDSQPGGLGVTAIVRDDSGQVAARGTVGLCRGDAVADRIETAPDHRRRGLASAIMSALARCAVAEGAADGILVASEEGQRLYAALGWRAVADVLIATARPAATG